MTSQQSYKPILMLDFDGCIHSYMSGWKGVDIVPDPPVPGIFAWLEKALEHFEIHVYSSRSSSPSGKRAIINYIKQHAPNATFHSRLVYTSEKSRAFIQIDDRCIRFDGDWTDPQFDPKTLLEFKSWYATSKK